MSDDDTRKDNDHESSTTTTDATITTNITTATLISSDTIASANELIIDISNIDDDANDKANQINMNSADTKNIISPDTKPTEDDSDNESWHSV